MDMKSYSTGASRERPLRMIFFWPQLNMNDLDTVLFLVLRE